jgi:hypothetical protein
MSQSHAIVRPFHALAATLLLTVLAVNLAHAAAKPSLTIKSAAYNKKTASLVVNTTGNVGGGLLSLIHSQGGVLGQSSDSEHIFTISQAQLGEIPCQVEARVGELKVSKVVAGASAECKKVPVCKLLTPASNISIDANVSTRFEAQVTLKDKKAAPLTIEWDFAGGAMSHPFERLLKNGKPVSSGKVSTEASFIRDNSRYHVRFAAIDKLGRRCESGTYVSVGTPPTAQPDSTPLALESQRSQPPRGSGLTGDTVVMPFEDRSMQNLTDTWAYADTGLNYPIPANTINAYVYQKGLQPVPLGSHDVELSYSAASNPADPVGPHSINSTSQNWPLNGTAKQASLLKGELFERFERPQNAELSPSYIHWTLVERLLGYDPKARILAPDEGGYNLSLSSLLGDHGSYMPGKASAYAINEAQPFTAFVDKDSWFSANWLPLSDIDDSGRVNPTSLFRVQAKQAGTQTPLATTDTVVTTSRDFHCRECHAKGKIAANDIVARTVVDQSMPLMLMSGADDSIQEQEYAAMQNATMLHAFYGPSMIGMRVMAGMNNGPFYADGPVTCGAGPSMCHSEPTADSLYQGKIGRVAANKISLSGIMHKMHATLQYNDSKSDILRGDTGRYLCWGKVDKSDCTVDPSRSLFPVKDANGKILPMEENCLKCHSGHREQTYRDRMFTAGVTCYQCHGDMLAVSELYEKSHTNPDGNPYRLEWLEQPDCGSCHTGSGNIGKDASKGYFSAGVKNLAFDENDPSATSTKVDLSNPDQSRFAVMPLTALEQSTAGYNAVLKTPLYRMGKDLHGQVACAACHGAAHSVWPNRDPNANDNVTALQLQGHTGAILDCNVCHQPNDFAEFDHLDEGQKVPDSKEKVLGGPHSLHPINDPNWWKTVAGDALNTDKTSSGGWHNDYAKLPGKAGEDQCAACHGNDHLGTRLSKTPVDRTFDFTDLPDQAALKTVGVKTKVTVKAGTPIGCNTCHTVALSCMNSPAGSDCGKPSEKIAKSTNKAPTVAPPFIIDAVIGQDLSYSLSASDPDRDAVSFDVAGDGTSSQRISIDATGTLSVPGDQISHWANDINTAQQLSNQFTRPPFSKDFKVVVADSKGAYSVQALTIRFDCPADLAWDSFYTGCSPIAFTATPPTGVVDGNPLWQYQVPVISATGSQLSYSLADPVPSGMSIDGNGLISWDTKKAHGDYTAILTVSDSDNNQTQLYLYLTVCRAPMHWDSDQNLCISTIQITSPAPTGASYNQLFSYKIETNQDQVVPINYSLTTKPAGMSIDNNGVITWNTTGFEDQYPLIQVEVNDGQGNFARQDAAIYVCPMTTPRWDNNQSSCLP